MNNWYAQYKISMNLDGSDDRDYNINPLSSDEAYLMAVNDKKLEIAKKMVKDQAKQNGFLPTPSGNAWMHWTPNGGFNKFKIHGNPDSRVKNGAFFTDSIHEIRLFENSSYGQNPQTYNVYLKYSNPLIHNVMLRGGLPEDEMKIIRSAKRLGHDAVIWKDNTMRDTTIAIFKPNQIKSIEPVTYDDSGNIIPLSKRFNSTSNDIRF